MVLNVQIITVLCICHRRRSIPH